MVVEAMLLPLVAQVTRHQLHHRKVTTVALVVLALVVAVAVAAVRGLLELLVRLKQVAMAAMEQHHLFLAQASLMLAVAAVEPTK